MSFGCTKNGAMAAEAVVFFNRELVRDFRFRYKRAGQLWCKLRFLSSQIEGYLANDCWLKNAAHANSLVRPPALSPSPTRFPNPRPPPLISHAPHHNHTHHPPSCPPI